MQIGSRPPLSAGYPAPAPQARRERPDTDADDRRRPVLDGRDPGPASGRILQGELIDDADGAPRDRVDPWQTVDPALRPAISAYQEMLQVDAVGGSRSGNRLDRYA